MLIIKNDTEYKYWKEKLEEQLKFREEQEKRIMETMSDDPLGSYPYALSNAVRDYEEKLEEKKDQK